MSSEDTPGSIQSTGTIPELQDEKPGSLRNDGTAPEPQEEILGSIHNPATVPELQIELPIITPEASENGEVDALLADMEKAAAVPKGKVVLGKVLKVTETEVRVNVGLSLEGTVPLIEFLSSDPRQTVTPGDEVNVWVEEYNEKEGTVTVSRQKAARLEVWEKIEIAFREQSTISGWVLDRIKGGLTVDIGIRAFMPSSQADLRPLRNPDSLLGQEITCKIIKVIRKRGNVVVSRKLALEEEANQRKAELLERLQEGVELVGRVKNLTDYGAFLDLGGVDGLLHVTDMAWGRVSHPSEIVQVDQEIKVKVLKFDPEKGRISLGLKQLLPDPWETVASTHHVGDRVTGRVTNVTDYGVFVELAPGVEGLVHVSEMSWSKRPKHPSKIVRADERVEVAVLDLNPAQRRVSLSLKQTLPDPWNTLPERYHEGSVVEATITNLTDYGAFVEVDSEIEGLIHNSDLSWTEKVKHPSEILKKGQQIKAVVLNLDSAHRRLSLGVKQLEPDPWVGFIARTRVGDMVKGKVARMAVFGAFVELEKGVEGLCHTSEFGDNHGASGKGTLDAGSEFEFRVIRLDPMERRISLSLKPAAAPVAARKSDKKQDSPSKKDASAAGSSESKKKPDTVTTMAEALSAAGITSRPTPRPKTPSPPTTVTAAQHSVATVAEPPVPPALAVKAEQETAVTSEERGIPTADVNREAETAAVGGKVVTSPPARKAEAAVAGEEQRS